MGSGYYRAIKTKKLIALLVRNGFVSVGGTKHGKYSKNNGSPVIIVPRHQFISAGTSKSICETLEKDFGISKKDLNKIF